MEQRGLTRREFLGFTGGGLVAAGMLGPQAVLAQSTTIRQGYQTNIWGMPTYYLLRSGVLEKRGLKFEEFAVPSEHNERREHRRLNARLLSAAGSQSASDRRRRTGLAVKDKNRLLLFACGAGRRNAQPARIAEFQLTVTRKFY